MSESVYTLFESSVKKHGSKPAIKYFCNTKRKWATKSWLDLSSDISLLADSLYNLGLSPKSAISIISTTRPEWVMCDIACMKIGAIVIPIYHSSLDDQVAYILKDSSASIIVVENEFQLKKVRDVQKNNGVKLSKVIIIDKVSSALLENEIYFAELLQESKEKFVFKDIDKHSVCSLVYTSGTTGEPKGAMISHDNFLYEAEVLEKTGIISEKDTQLLFLPLAHIFARILEMVWLRTGHLLAFCQSIDSIVDDMTVVKPTIMASVPRIYEKIRNKIIETAMQEGFLKRNVAKLIFDNASKLCEKNDAANKMGLFLAKKLVFDKIAEKLKEKFGGKLRFFISGGAQLSMDVANFFYLADVMICEGYGLTETTGAATLNLPWSFRFGTVGRALSGTEAKIDQDGEICIRGRGVFLGFWNKPEETKMVLSKDGWFKTGDIGKIDEDGFIKIIDRKKDIIVTSQGKNISPQRIENIIKAQSPIISQAVIVGDAKPYLVCLIALDFSQTKSMVNEKDKEKIIKSSTIISEVDAAVKKSNSMLANFEQIKKFKILPDEFKVGVELTPTLKLKRKFCIHKYKKQIDNLYK